MRIWDPDGVARHFTHVGNFGHSKGGDGDSECESVAESDKHIKWKSLAAERLEESFSGNVEECTIEKGLAAPVSDHDRRVGDVVLIFDERDEQLGEGLVVEVQHKNHSKDIDATTRDFIAQDFAVVWTDSNDYSWLC